MEHISKEIYIAVLFDIHPRFTYSLGTYFTEAEAIERIRQHCNPYEMKQTDTPNQVSYHCTRLGCMVWVKKLMIGDAPDNKVILTNTAPQDSRGDGSTIEGIRLKVAQCELLPQILNSLKCAKSEQRLHSHTCYVFPTSRIDYNDPHSTALNNTRDLIAILNVDMNRKIWIEIIELLTDIIKEDGSKNVIDNFYHGQVNKFLTEWNDFNYRTVRQRWYDFTNVVMSFEKTWVDVSCVSNY